MQNKEKGFHGRGDHTPSGTAHGGCGVPTHAGIQDPTRHGPAQAVLVDGAWAEQRVGQDKNGKSAVGAISRACPFSTLLLPVTFTQREAGPRQFTLEIPIPPAC